MTTTLTNPNANGSAKSERKSLASQIDRLDEMLEGLSDNLNAAVADAVKDAVRQAVGLAVQAAIREVLTSPELLERLRASVTPALANSKAAPAGPGTFARMATTLNRWAAEGWAWAKSAVTDAWTTTKSCYAELKGRAEMTWAWLRSVAWLLVCLLYAVRRPVLIAAAVGVTIAVGSYFAGPLVASLVSGLGGMATTLGTLVLLPWRRPAVPAMSSDTLA